jgi:hypothetical protein
MKTIIKDTLHRVLKIIAYINNKDFDPNIECCIETNVQGYDGALLHVNGQTGDVDLISWKESGHNGDVYGRSHKRLSEQAAIQQLQIVFFSLKEKAIDIALHQIKKKRECDDLSVARETIEALLR